MSIEITQKLLDEIKSCCHNGHGASIFPDGSVIQAISSNDVLAYSTNEGWVYRVAYVDNPDVTLEDLECILGDKK